jgi:hypothetical protein
MKFADKNFATDINTIKLFQMINKQTFFSSVTFFVFLLDLLKTELTESEEQ